jgi:hypothetical protein
MKTARWVTGIGSVILFATGIFHGMGFQKLQEMIAASGLKEPLLGILQACWFTFSGEMMVLAVIAFVASLMENGARIVLICAAISAVNGVLLLKFLGPFIGVYITAFVMALFLAGGLLQGKR